MPSRTLSPFDKRLIARPDFLALARAGQTLAEQADLVGKNEKTIRRWWTRAP